MELGLTLGILTLATLGQTIMGFGGGLIAIPLLSLLVGVKDAVILVLVTQIPFTLLGLYEGRAAPWRRLIPMIIALLTMTLLGTYFLGAFNEAVLRLMLAGFILLFLLKSTFWQQARLIPSKRPLWGVLTGSTSGFLQGMLGTGGPPLVIYFNETMDNKDAIRVALLLFLGLSNIVRIGVAVPTGLFRAELMPTMGWSIPCVLTAIFVGQRLHHAVSEIWYRRAILLLLTGSCISLLSKSF